MPRPGQDLVPDFDLEQFLSNPQNDGSQPPQLPEQLRMAPAETAGGNLQGGLASALEAVFSNTAQQGSGQFEGPDETQQPGALSSLIGGVGRLLNLGSGDPSETREGPIGSEIDVFPQKHAENTKTGFTQGDVISIDQGAEEKIPHEIGHVAQNRINPIGNILRSFIDKGTESGVEAGGDAHGISALIRAAEGGDEQAAQTIESMDPREIEDALAFSQNKAPGLMDILTSPGSGSFLLRNK